MGWRVTPGRGAIEWNGKENHRWKVIAVPDGDTVLIGGGPHRQAKEWLRMLCIDCPEHGQRGSSEARDCLRALILGKYCTIEPEKKWKYQRDRYGRTLCYILQDDLLINAEMVRQGWSTYYTRHGRGRFAQTFSECEVWAESERIGVWQYYNSGDRWAWGRGRSKRHYRGAEEIREASRQIKENGGLKDG